MVEIHTTPPRITREKVDIDDVMSSVQSPGAGGAVLFIGTVRDNSEAGDVDEMLYDAYASMAEKRLLEIESDVLARWPVAKVRTQHRIGLLKVGDISVAVAVSTPHRAEAFEACRYAIERIKREVPIWKKERLAGGEEVWVEGQPIGDTPTEKRGTNAEVREASDP